MSSQQLIDRLRSRQARLGVIGLGYVGLPLAVEFARAGFDVTGIDLDARKVADLNRGESLHPGRLVRRPQRGRQGRAVQGDHRLQRARRSRHRRHLRPDAAAQDQGPRHVLHRVGGRAGGEVPAQGAARRPRVDDLSGDDRGSAAADARGRRPEGRHRLLPRVLARARRPGQSAVAHGQHSEGGRWPERGVDAGGLRALRAGGRVDHPGGVDARGRDGETAREHVPGREHRDGERAGADVPSR